MNTFRKNAFTAGHHLVGVAVHPESGTWAITHDGALVSGGEVGGSTYANLAHTARKLAEEHGGVAHTYDHIAMAEHEARKPVEQQVALNTEEEVVVFVELGVKLTREELLTLEPEQIARRVLIKTLASGDDVLCHVGYPGHIGSIGEVTVSMRHLKS